MEEVIVVKHNPDWVRQYQEEAARIIAAIADICLEIEHIGSTAVPGLSAKPILDMMVGVQSLDMVSSEHKAQLLELGYEYVHKPEFPDRLFFRRGKWRAGTHHLHIYKLNSSSWRNQLLFRDYLRNHPDKASEYELLKRKLEQQYQFDRVAYTHGKGDFIQDVIRLASEDM